MQNKGKWKQTQFPYSKTLLRSLSDKDSGEKGGNGREGDLANLGLFLFCFLPRERVGRTLYRRVIFVYLGRMLDLGSPTRPKDDVGSTQLEIIRLHISWSNRGIVEVPEGEG